VKHFRLLLSSAFIAVTLAGLAVRLSQPARAASVSGSDSRSFEFTYQVHFPATPGAAGASRLWLPAPSRHVVHQTPPVNLIVLGDVKHATGHDSEYGNEFVVFTPTPEQAAAGFDAGIRFSVTREEYAVLRNGAAVQETAAGFAPPPLLDRYLQPDKLVPLNGVIADLARHQTAGATTPLEKARKIYDYVVSTMHYDHAGEGWGRGDAVWACDSKHGNCTDFHSVFIGMMRAAGIPARFEIGFQIPTGKSEGEISGYHCWSEFYVSGIGWIPIDASEASQHTEKKDYFFGALDPNRVLFTYGRDIRLSSDQKGDPLNYFIYPYAEAGGQSVKNLERHFSFRDLSVSSQGTTAR